MDVWRRYPSLISKFKNRLLNYLKDQYWFNKSFRRYIQSAHMNVNRNIELEWIDPNNIEYMQVEADSTDTNFRYLYNRVPMHSPEKARFDPLYYSGVVLDGNWDEYIKPHRFDRVYSSLREWLSGDTELENTEYIYQYRLRENTYREDGFCKKEIEKTKNLYRSIRRKGFMTRYELGQLEESLEPYWPYEQWGITVNRGRDGKVIFNNTAHNRLALAKILDIDRVPVVTVVRHKKWCEKEGIQYS